MNFGRLMKRSRTFHGLGRIHVIFLRKRVIGLNVCELFAPQSLFSDLMMLWSQNVAHTVMQRKSRAYEKLHGSFRQ